MVRFFSLCESGGIGRRTGFRFQRATVGVQIPSLAPAFNKIKGLHRSLEAVCRPFIFVSFLSCPPLIPHVARFAGIHIHLICDSDATASCAEAALRFFARSPLPPRSKRQARWSYRPLCRARGARVLPGHGRVRVGDPSRFARGGWKKVGGKMENVLALHLFGAWLLGFVLLAGGVA